MVCTCNGAVACAYPHCCCGRLLHPHRISRLPGVVALCASTHKLRFGSPPYLSEPESGSQMNCWLIWPLQVQSCSRVPAVWTQKAVTLSMPAARAQW